MGEERKRGFEDLLECIRLMGGRDVGVKADGVAALRERNGKLKQLVNGYEDMQVFSVLKRPT